MCPTPRAPHHGEGETEGTSSFWFFNHRTTPTVLGMVEYFESAKVILFLVLYRTSRSDNKFVSAYNFFGAFAM